VAAASLSISEARLVALRAQGLAGARLGDPAAMLQRLGAVQLDTISVLARTHLLVAWSRLGAVPAAEIEAAYWSQSAPTTFEYWAHAACIIPIERWPTFEFRRRAARRRERRWHRLEDPEASTGLVRSRLASEGPLLASELGGTTRGGPWWDWTEAKIAVENLLDTGEVVCVARRGWRRVYDLAERAIPAGLLRMELSDHECRLALVQQAARSLGVATAQDLGRHHKMTIAEVTGVLADADLVEVAVEGSDRPWYATIAALESLSRPAGVRTTLLSPFDSLLWERPFVERLFGYVHRLEAYVPRPQRVHGYYAMPILAGSELVGAVDPAKAKDTLVVRHISLKGATAVPPATIALQRAARWIAASRIQLERVTPERLRVPLERLLASRMHEEQQV
jgi:uncharacterized protein YcaQ